MLDEELEEECLEIDQSQDILEEPKIEIEPLDLYGSTYDFTSEAKNRLKGITKEEYVECVKMCQNIYEMMPTFERDQIEAEISSWDFSIPSEVNTEYEDIAETYSRLIAYNFRLTTLIDIAYRRSEFLNEAHKSLKEMAHKLYTGTKGDKDANASFMVFTWLALATNAKAQLKYLIECKSSLTFASENMKSLMYERHNIAKINNNDVNIGNAVSYNRMLDDEYEKSKDDKYVDVGFNRNKSVGFNKKPEIKIKTRNLV